MCMRNANLAAMATVMALSTLAAAASARDETAYGAHDRYLAAINANDPDAVLASVTDDVVLVAPNTPVMVGKAAVGPWVRGYFDAVGTTWQQRSVEFVVTGDWAFERYSYRAVDTPHEGGPRLVETGNGLNIYKAGPDGVWRVARDIRVTDGLVTLSAGHAFEATCAGAAAPC